MTGVLIDTDVLIELLRGRNDTVRDQFENLLATATPLYISAVTLAEIAQGARDNELDSIAALYVFLKCESVDCRIADVAGGLLRRYRKSHSVDFGDGMIAATAIEIGLRLWTKNYKHYPDPRVQFLFEPHPATPSVALSTSS